MSTPPDFDISRFPPHLILPLPRNLERGRGITSVTGPNKCLITYRGVISERDKLAKAAAIMGMASTAFHRCLVNDAADYIINYAEKSGTTFGFGPPQE